MTEEQKVVTVKVGVGELAGWRRAAALEVVRSGRGRFGVATLLKEGARLWIERQGGDGRGGAGNAPAEGGPGVEEASGAEPERGGHVAGRLGSEAADGVDANGVVVGGDREPASDELVGGDTKGPVIVETKGDAEGWALRRKEAIRLLDSGQAHEKMGETRGEAISRIAMEMLKGG